MWTYAFLDSLFIVPLTLLCLYFRSRIAWRLALYTLLMVGLFTLVFDNLIIGLHFYGYINRHISGVHIYKMPIEDLAYPLVSTFLIALLWGRNE